MTFNYSKLASLKPKFLEEEKTNNQKIEDRAEDQVVASHHPQEVASSGYPPASHQLATNELKSNKNQMVASHQNHRVASHRKGDRHSKNKVLLGIRQTADIVRQVKEFCAKHNLQLQDFYELAASHYISHVASHQPANELATMVASQLAHDDLMIFKTHDDIIMLFKQMTGRKWTASDDRTAAPFNGVDRRLIEIGMINTVIQARGRRINSFAYFIPEIQTMIDLHVDNQNLDAYLRRRRELLTKYRGPGKS